MKRLYWDTETDKLPPKKFKSLDECPHIVQLAAILVDDEMGEVASMNFTINQMGRIIPDETAAIHGITTEMSNQFGIPAQIAMSSFSHLCRAADQIIAHNTAFDEKIYGYEIDRIKQVNILKEKDTFCTMLSTVEFCKIPSNNNWSKYKWPKLLELHEILFGEGFDGAHDALVDVRACQRCHKELIKRGIV